MRNSARVVGYCIGFSFWLERKIPQADKRQIMKSSSLLSLDFAANRVFHWRL